MCVCAWERESVCVCCTRVFWPANIAVTIWRFMFDVQRGCYCCRYSGGTQFALSDSRCKRSKRMRRSTRCSWSSSTCTQWAWPKRGGTVREKGRRTHVRTRTRWYNHLVSIKKKCRLSTSKISGHKYDYDWILLQVIFRLPINVNIVFGKGGARKRRGLTLDKAKFQVEILT